MDSSSIIRRRRESDCTPSSITFASESEASSLDPYGHEDMTDEDSEAPAPLVSYREPHTYTQLATILKWAYIDKGEDRGDQNHELGISYFVRPAIHLLPQEESLLIPHLMRNIPPHIIASVSHTSYPLAAYNPINRRYLISPHPHSYPDLRQNPSHPDWLPTSKLCQYQALEHLGYQVWRHDQNFSICQLPSCKAALVDHDPATLICLGCDPKTIVRYCGKQHQLQDLRRHWRNCGNENLVLKLPVDEATQPSRFYRRYPTIRGINGKNSFQKTRQRVHAIWNKGQYTLFIDKNALPLIIEWSEDLITEYKPLVERLLNIALFDETQTGVILYLYCVLRMALRRQDLWTAQYSNTLKIQFHTEFNWSWRLAWEDDPCECIWLGDSADSTKCTRDCKSWAREVGVIFRGAGLKSTVRMYERKYWMVRIWQRQHPTVKAWRSRLVGDGFDVPQDKRMPRTMIPMSAKGWHGFGIVDPEAGLWRIADQLEVDGQA